MREEIAQLKADKAAREADLAAARGVIQLLEAREADGDDAAGVGGEGQPDRLPAEDARPGAFLVYRRPVRDSAHVQNARAKSELRAWASIAIAKCWITIGEEPTVAGSNVKMVEMRTMLPKEQHLGQEARDIDCAVLDSSSSDDQLRHRLNAITRQVSGLGAVFFVG